MRSTLWTLLMLALPGVLSAQDARLDRIRQAFPPDIVARIETILAEASAADVPAAPILDKALEGAAKRVPPERVLTAMSAYADRLAEARSLIGHERAAGAVVAAADALGRGVPGPNIRSLAESRDGEIAVALVVLADLVERQVPVERAQSVVEEALARGGRDEDLLAIPFAVDQLIREGQLPDAAAQAVASAFAAGWLPTAPMPSIGPGVAPPAGPPVPPGAGPPEQLPDAPVTPPGSGI